MESLVDSIRENGILNPVIVRPNQTGDYEMISGHRRLYAAGIVGLVKIPAIVKEMSDDEAIIKMVDANIQREELLPSEKAFAYKMKLEAIKRTAGRPSSNNSCQSGTHLRSDHELAEQVGESARSIQRYIRLTNLIPERSCVRQNTTDCIIPRIAGTSQWMTLTDGVPQHWDISFIGRSI